MRDAFGTSNAEITLALWEDPDNDDTNEVVINQIMNRTCIFRKARINYFEGYEEYQCHLPLNIIQIVNE